jgi:hypothetical protein
MMKYLLIVLFAFALCAAKTDTLEMVIHDKTKRITYPKTPRENTEFYNVVFVIKHKKN